MLSNKLIERVKLSPKRQYRIAHEADIHPSTLSQIINGIVKVKKGDERIIKLGRTLGLKENELFE